MIGGCAVLALFCWIETRVPEPMFRLSLFKIRAFTFGNVASLLGALGRGGLMFILIGIYMLPMTVGFLVAGPNSGWLSDRFGARILATGGMLVAAASFVWLWALPVNFSYWQFAAALLINGLGMGLFAAPNRTGIMNSLPAHQRGVGGGMSTVFSDSAMVLSIGIFFSLMITGLAASLPGTLMHGLTVNGVPHDAAARVAQLPPVGVLFASLLGYNPIQSLLDPHVLHQLPAATQAHLTGHGFFPALISQPFSDGLGVAFSFAITACLVVALASAFRGGKYIHNDDESGSSGQGSPSPAELVAEGVE